MEELRASSAALSGSVKRTLAVLNRLTSLAYTWLGQSQTAAASFSGGSAGAGVSVRDASTQTLTSSAPDGLRLHADHYQTAAGAECSDTIGGQRATDMGPTDRREDKSRRHVSGRFPTPGRVTSFSKELLALNIRSLSPAAASSPSPARPLPPPPESPLPVTVSAASAPAIRIERQASELEEKPGAGAGGELASAESVPIHTPQGVRIPRELGGDVRVAEPTLAMALEPPHSYLYWMPHR